MWALSESGPTPDFTQGMGSGLEGVQLQSSGAAEAYISVLIKNVFVPLCLSECKKQKKKQDQYSS